MSALYSCLKGKNDTIMAANATEGTVSVEVVGSPEEGSGKKKSKFQAFKKLFVKKKRKESPAPSRESKLKPSQSSSDVSASGANETVFHPAQESVPKSNMGSKAVSHDSVFISEMENSTKEDTSQENTPGKVKALQLQLQQNIRIGSPPQGIVHKKLEDSGTLSEDDGLPRSPPEITSLHEILTQSSSKNFSTAQRRNSLSLGGTDSEDDPESGESSSCPISPQNSSVHLSPASQANHYTLVDFTSPPSSVACLDNSAAKHKIAVKPKKRRGLGMNVNCKKQEEGPYTMERVKKNDNEVVCKHEASIPQSGESSVEEDTPNKDVPLMEDEVVQVNTDVSLASQEDLSLEATMDVNTSVAYETSLTDKQIMELYTEEDESDVDFHRNSVAMEDLVNGTEQTEINKESIQLPQIIEPVIQNEHEETTAHSDPVEINDTKIEIVHLEVSEEHKCDLSDNSINIEQDISVFETNESLDNENKGEKNDYEEMFSDLLELEFEILDISTFGTNMLLTPQKEMLKIESPTGILKANEDVAFTSFAIYNCTDAGNELNAETLPESSLSNAVTNEPGISDTPSSNQKVDNLDIKTESSKNVTVYGSVKSSTESMHLASKIDCSGDNAVSTKDPSSETSKTIKPLQENVDSKFTTSNRPVRFTVAPAWQRSFSVGLSTKESNFSKDKVASRSESFDVSEMSGVEISQDNVKESQKNNEIVETSKEDSCAAFGVRLRRTSSSRKHSEDYSEEQTKQSPLSVDTAVSLEDVQIPTKAPQVPSDVTKFSKPSHRGEDKPWQKKKSIDLSLQENSEPAWITMAKQKQKGFQEHPLARVTGVASENDKSEESESLQKNNSISSAQELEVRMIGPTSANSSVSMEDVRPDSGKSTRSTLSEEPPWFSLAKKKAKAWSEMPPIVQ